MLDWALAVLLCCSFFNKSQAGFVSCLNIWQQRWYNVRYWANRKEMSKLFVKRAWFYREATGRAPQRRLGRIKPNVNPGAARSDVPLIPWWIWKCAYVSGNGGHSGSNRRSVCCKATRWERWGNATQWDDNADGRKKMLSFVLHSGRIGTTLTTR